MSIRNNSAAAISVKLVLTIAAALAATGCALVIFGCLFEGQFQLDLLRTSGFAALDAYLAQVASHQLSFAAFMVESVTGHCYARSAFLQGIGFWFVFAFAPASAALLSTARLLAARDRSMNPRLRLAPAH
jgi:hypothetical protein